MSYLLDFKYIIYKTKKQNCNFNESEKLNLCFVSFHFVVVVVVVIMKKKL